MRKSSLIDCSILLLITFLVYSPWFESGTIARADLFLPTKAWLQDHLSIPHIWSNEHGGFHDGIWQTAQYPLHFLWAFLVIYLGMDVDLTMRFIWCYSFLVVSVFSMYYLCHTLFANRIVSFVATLFFLHNNVILNQMQGGYVGAGMSTAMIPLTLAFLVKGLKESPTRNSVLVGVTLAITIYYDIKIALISSAIIGSFILFHLLVKYCEGKEFKKESIHVLTCVVIFSSVTLLLNAFWVLPTLFSGITGVSSNASQPSYINVRSYNPLLFSLTLSYKPRFEMHQILMTPAFFLTILTFMAIVLRPRNKVVLFFTLLALVFVFMSKSQYPPLGFLYFWLYDHVPGFVAFRSSEKTLLVQRFFYAVLLGVSVEAIYSFIDSNKPTNAMYKKGFLSLIVLLVFLCIYPALFGKHSHARTELGGSTFDPKPLSNVHRKLIDRVREQEPDFRFLMFPAKPAYLCDDVRHPGVYPDLPQGSLHNFASYFFTNHLKHEGVLARGLTVYFSKIVGLLNIKNIYLLPKSCPHYQWSSSKPLELIKEALAGQKGFRHTYLTGSSERAVPRLYKVPSLTEHSQGSAEIRRTTKLRKDVTKHKYARKNKTRGTQGLVPASIPVNLYSVLLRLAALGSSTFEDILIYENDYVLPRVYGVCNAALVVGGKSFLLPASILNIDFSEWAFFFASQLQNATIGSIKAIDTVIFYEKEFEDLLLATINNDYKMNLWKYAELAKSGKPTEQRPYGTFEPDENYWLRYFDHYWIDANGEFYENTGGVLLQAGIPNVSLDVPWTAKKSGKYDIWVRMGVGHDIWTLGEMGQVTLYVDHSPVCHLLSTQNDSMGLKWFHASSLQFSKGKYIISLMNKKGISTLDELVIVPHEEMAAHTSQLVSLLSSKNKIFIKEGEVSFVSDKGDWEHRMFGGEASGGYALTTKDYSASTSTNITVHEENEYVLGARLAKNLKGDITVYVDDRVVFSMHCEKDFNSNLTWVETPSFNLKPGKHELRFHKQGIGTLDLDMVMLFRKGHNVSSLFERDNPVQVSWKMKNTTRYDISASSHKPFFLMFAEGYSPLWTATYEDVSVKSSIANTLVNSFFIDKASHVEIQIDYPPQKYARFGFYLFLVSFTAIVLFLKFNRNR